LIAGAIDLTHASGAKRSQDFVCADALTASEWNTRSIAAAPRCRYVTVLVSDGLDRATMPGVLERKQRRSLYLPGWPGGRALAANPTVAQEALTDAVNLDAGSQPGDAPPEKCSRTRMAKICAWCRRVHMPDGTWQPGRRATDATMPTHGICPDCSQRADVAPF
jgi:hypothetical protein